MQLVTNFELRRREVELDLAPVGYGTKLLNTADCANLARLLLADKVQEHFVVFLLSLEQRVLGYQTVSVGTQSMCPIDMRVLFRGAITVGASYIVITHNHPEGNPKPSPQDVQVTDMVQLAADVIGIPLLDHIIVGADSTYSLKAAGIMMPSILRTILK